MAYTDSHQPGDQGLAAQIRSDPRVQAIVQQRRSGRLSAAELRQLGYQVPEGYAFSFGGRAGLGTLMDGEQSWFEQGYPAIAIGTVAGLGAAGALPGFGASGAAASAEGTAAGLGQYGADVAAANQFAPMAALPSAQAVPASVAMNAVPGAATSAGIGGTAAGVGGAGSAISRFLGDGNLRDLAGLGVAGLGAVNGLRTPSATASLERMLGLAEQRVTDSKPLFDALNTMAMAGLPKYARGEQ